MLILFYFAVFLGAAYLLYKTLFQNKAAPHDAYFANLSTELKNNGPGHPVLVLDLDRLDKNLDAAVKYMHQSSNWRIPAKSLPCAKLIAHICQKSGSKRIMVFHRPFLSLMLKTAPKSYNYLLGKPFPLQTLTYFYQNLPQGVDKQEVSTRIQWLIDSPQRARQYLSLAQQQQLKLLLNIELDVGMHRGGVDSLQQLFEICQLITENSQHLEFAGFMGYEAHIAKMPLASKTKIEQQRIAAMDKYRQYQDYVKNNFAALYHQNLTFNGSGTQTYQLYKNDTTLNDICFGSGLVKPTDFDLNTVENQQAAMFIASPVVKVLPGLSLPFVSKASQFVSRYLPNLQQTIFSYGGYWKAIPESPAGMRYNLVYGRSSNQEMLNVATRANIKQDDYIFLRPTQSEAVMLDFNHILIIRNGKIIDKWSNFNQDLITENIV